MKKIFSLSLAVLLVLIAAFLFSGEQHLQVSNRVSDGVLPKEDIVKIFAVGDIMLDRNVRKLIGINGNNYPFQNVLDLFKGHDIMVGNLEGGFTDFESIAMKDTGVLRFTFDPLYAPYLRSIGFDTLSLANNHAADFGPIGMAQNRSYLEANDFYYFGSPSNDSNLSIVRDIRGKKIAFVGYHEFYSPDVQLIAREIIRLRPDADFIIVYPHWGVEYEEGFTEGQSARAHAFIDAGADVVIGAHPHVIEPLEIYNGKPIFYSLGNFLFDQDFSVATREGFALSILLSDEAVKYELVPFAMLRSSLFLPDEKGRSRILSFLAEKSFVLPEYEHMIMSGKLEFKREGKAPVTKGI